jgi:hypothetical protein
LKANLASVWYNKFLKSESIGSQNAEKNLDRRALDLIKLTILTTSSKTEEGIVGTDFETNFFL